MTEVLEAERNDRSLEGQKVGAKQSMKVMSHNMLRDISPLLQHTQRNLASIQLARKKRKSGKRPIRELAQLVFEIESDGKIRSVNSIARSCQMSWSTSYWLLDFIEYIQRQPVLSRVGGMRRKRFYQILGPRRR